MPLVAGYPYCKSARLTQKLQARGPYLMNVAHVISLFNVIYLVEVLKLGHVVTLL
jgi:hypothetical protein